MTIVPDFEQIALSIMSASDDEPGQSRIAEQLRLVWNARGAADRVELDAARQKIPLFPQAAALAAMLDRAIRSLDR